MKNTLQAKKSQKKTVWRRPWGLCGAAFQFFLTHPEQGLEPNQIKSIQEKKILFWFKILIGLKKRKKRINTKVLLCRQGLNINIDLVGTSRPSNVSGDLQTDNIRQLDFNYPIFFSGCKLPSGSSFLLMKNTCIFARAEWKSGNIAVSRTSVWPKPIW